MAQIVLQTHGITKQYKSQLANDHIGITIEKGDIYGLVGQNGAGKTTLIRMIAGLTPPSSGEIVLFGKSDAAGLNASRHRIGCVVETPVLFANLTAEQNLEYYRLQRGIADKNCIQNALNLVNLTDTGSKKFKSFSLGMKQRLGIALAMLNSPELILLDEPVNGLDPTGIIDVRNAIRHLSDLGTTIIISSHLLLELAQIATRYGFIHNGKLIQEISDTDLKKACRQALHLSVDDAAKAAQLLEADLDVRSYEILDFKTLRIFTHMERSADIAKVLVQNGILLYSMYEIDANLEDYYVNLIRGVS